MARGKYDYIVAASAIVNDVEYFDGTKTTRKLGGGIFSLEGVRCWTENVLYMTNTGPDYRDFYGKYMEDNKLSYEGVDDHYLDHTHYTTVHYREDGTFYEESIYENDDFIKNITYGRPKLEQIAPFAKYAKGICLSAGVGNIGSEIWEGMWELREKYGFKLMWEVPTHHTAIPELRENLFKTIDKVDFYSMNRPESFDMFDVDSEEAAIEKILKIDTPCFYRVGAKGSYMISGGECVFIPSILIGEAVDPTGCGNCSTTAASYAFCEGHDNLMIGIMANIAAGYNIAQSGPYPKFTDETLAYATKLANETYEKLKNR